MTLTLFALLWLTSSTVCMLLGLILTFRKRGTTAQEEQR